MKDELLLMLLIPIHVCNLTTRDSIYDNRKREELAGVKFSSDYKLLEVIRDNFLTAPKDSSLGLIRIGSGGDFVIINDINYTKQQIVAIKFLFSSKRS